MGMWKCGRVGVWECGRVGVWACGNVGMWEHAIAKLAFRLCIEQQA